VKSGTITITITITITLTLTNNAKDMDANEDIVARLKQWMEIMVHD